MAAQTPNQDKTIDNTIHFSLALLVINLRYALRGHYSAFGKKDCQPIAHFGLGAATLVDVTVEWADGSTTAMNGLAVDQILEISPSVSSTPGESSPQSDPARQLRAAWNADTGRIEVIYDPSCAASDHTIYWGDLDDVAAYAYSGAECWCGDTGTASFDPGGTTNLFFLIVGNNGSVEGSYGRDHADEQRPEDVATAGCDLPRDLSGACE